MRLKWWLWLPTLSVSVQAANCQIWGLTESGCLYLGLGSGLSYLAPDVSQSTWERTGSWSLPLKATAGYSFHPHYQVELSYSHLGAAQLTHASNGSANLYYGAPAFWFVGNAYDDGLGLPWNLQARIGLSALHSSTDNPSVPLKQHTQVQIALGLGGYWQLDRHWRVRLDFDNFDRDARSLIVSGHYLFGAR